MESKLEEEVDKRLEREWEVLKGEIFKQGILCATMEYANKKIRNKHNLKEGDNSYCHEIIEENLSSAFQRGYVAGRNYVEDPENQDEMDKNMEKTLRLLEKKLGQQQRSPIPNRYL